MIKAGKKTKEWNDVRKELKIHFQRWGITFCESRIPHTCTRDNYLGFAHPRKRRELKDGEIWIVILICNNAHDIIEYKWSREAMANYVFAVQKERGVYFNGEKEVFV